MQTVNENSTAILTVTFTDENGDAAIPSGGQYTIYDVLSGITIKAWTDFTPSSATHDIEITDEENSIIDDTQLYETRRVTVKWKYGAGKSGTGEFIYRVKNLEQIE
jgi:expansin (peptidoglycan-binding protein)